MEENYDEIGKVDSEMDDNSLFHRHVIADDHDLLAIDDLLRNIFSTGADE